MTKMITTAKRPIQTEPVIPSTIYPSVATTAAIAAYGICVTTWSIWLHPAPVADKIVVSEIGDVWSPNTAPASTADNAGNNKSG